MAVATVANKGNDGGDGHNSFTIPIRIQRLLKAIGARVMRV